MWLDSLRTSRKWGPSRSRRLQPRPARSKKARLFLEQLETRATPSFGLSTLGIFNGANGIEPQGSLIMDSSGNLYGTATQGGASGDGTVFELAKGSSTITTLATFNGGSGQDPRGGLIMDGSGNLYGTTVFGGASNDGTVFELAKGSSTITTLASFNSTTGQGPPAGLIMDSSGNLYGTAVIGGASDDGTIFELASGSSTITVLASFNGTNGSEPFAGLIMDRTGNLYGTTKTGGASGDGTVFEVAKGSSTITDLVSFNGSNGSLPFAGLIMDSSGNLYGTTYGGGASGDGTVFELAAGSGRITTMVSFVGSNGANPITDLIMDSGGNFYGTAGPESASDDNTIFELPAAATPIATASFLKSDTTTKGSWIGVYGSQGYNIVSGPTSLPSYATVTPSGQSVWTYSTTASDPRALQVPGSTNRVAAVWYSVTSFTVDVNLTDGQKHDLELYFTDWDNKGRAEQIQISTPSGTVLDTQPISSFVNGEYLNWQVSGNVVITITRTAGANAVLNGVFLDPPVSPSTASFIKSDLTTQGSWIGAGPVSLAGKLMLKENNRNLDYTRPQTLQLINSTGATTGTFQDLPDGNNVRLGRTFFRRIHNAGGTGNDMTLSL